MMIIGPAGTFHAPTKKENYMDIRVSTPNHIKAKMRKIKTLPAGIKAALLKGCKDQMVYVQFHQDLATYGLWEAMLYVQSYEGDGKYAEGTAHAAMDAYFKTKSIAKLLGGLDHV